jgi:hypothetical protein
LLARLRGIGVGVVEDVERSGALGNEDLERHAGLGVVDGDRHVPVTDMPKQSDVDAVAHSAVELARHGARLGFERQVVAEPGGRRYG